MDAAIAPLHSCFSSSPHQIPPPHRAKPVKVSTFAPFETRISSPLQLSGSNRPCSELGLSDGESQVKSLVFLKSFHAKCIKTSRDWNSDSTAKKLISNYLNLGEIGSACVVFFTGFSQNYASWSYFLAEIENHGGDGNQVLRVFRELHSKGVMFNGKTLAAVLKFCTVSLESSLGLEIHASLIKGGLNSNLNARRALMNFYGRNSGIESANQVFDEMPQRKDPLWNEAISLNLRNERWDKAMELFKEMHLSNVKPNVSTIARMLQGCGKMGALEEGKQIHGYVLKSLMQSDFPICHSLISMYSRNDRLKLARRVFDSMDYRDLFSCNSMIHSYVKWGYLDDAWDILSKMESYDLNPDMVTWNSLLSGHALHGSFSEVLMILQRMQAQGFGPNSSSVISLLQVVNETRHFNAGQEIHGYVIRNRLDSDEHVGSSLVDMYVKSNCLASARAVLDHMKYRNVVVWNSLISGYSFKGLFEEAKFLMSKMEEKGIKPNLVTWNLLIFGYSICGQSKEALSLIQKMKDSGVAPNVVSWSSLISGSSQIGNHREALDFFTLMQQEFIKPNSTTISSLLRTCGTLTLLQMGKEVHCHSIRNGFMDDRFVVTALIDMYCKSGNLKAARKIFDKIEDKELATWSCMMMGYAIYGLGKEVILLFNEMLRDGIRPDAITYTALLSGCKNSGLVEEGWKFFNNMTTEHKLVPSIEHYSCIVDLLGRAGDLKKALELIQTMPYFPDASVWGSLLAASRIHKNIEYAEIASKKLFELEPHNLSSYVLLMNLYSVHNRWEDVERVKDLMSQKGVKKCPNWSWIQIHQTRHLFVAEENHPDEREIHRELNQLVSEMKEFGYKPDLNCVYQNVDEAEKEKVLLGHTEKLAVAYGLIKSKGSAPIRVVNSARMCRDCHKAMKYASIVRNREIILKDAIRFHHFREGKCSCNDRW